MKNVYILIVFLFGTACNEIGNGKPGFLNEANLNESINCSIDLAKIERQSEGGLIGRVAGWISDDSMHQPSEIYVMVQDESGNDSYFRAEQMASDDVAKALNSPALTKSRFDITFPVENQMVKYRVLANIAGKAWSCHGLSNF